MDISFRTTKLQKECNSDALLKRRHKVQRAKLIRRRLDDLDAVETLKPMRDLPGHCHELHGDRKGQLAIDLDGLYRLILVPDHAPVPRLADGGLDWTCVTAVKIIGVEDYHG